MTEVDPPQFDRPSGTMPRGSDKPKFFTPITVSAIILGSLFGCCGATTVAGHLVTRAAPTALQMPGDDPTIREFTERNMEFQAKIFPYAISAGALGMLHSIALLGAGILAYQRRAIGRKLLIAVCVVGIGVELVSSAVGFYVTKHTSANATEMMRAALAAQESKQPAADSEQAAQNREKVAGIASKMTTVLGIGFAIVWLVFKTAYYVTCAFYLRRREVVQYFEPAHAN